MDNGLDSRETEKPLVKGDSLVNVLRYHYASDINVLPHERQWVQVAALLLLGAFTDSRPDALLNITYIDLILYVERDSKTGEHILLL